MAPVIISATLTLFVTLRWPSSVRLLLSAAATPARVPACAVVLCPLVPLCHVASRYGGRQFPCRPWNPLALGGLRGTLGQGCVAAVNLACAAASLAFALAPSCAEDGTLAGGAWAVAGMLLARAVAALACALAFDGMLLAGVVTAVAFAGTVLAIALGVRTCPTISHSSLSS